MKTIPMDAAGRVVLPKEVRSRLNLHSGDRFEAEVSADQVTLRLIRTSPGGLTRHGKRVIWDAPGVDVSESDFTTALNRSREDRDQRSSGL